MRSFVIILLVISSSVCHGRSIRQASSDRIIFDDDLRDQLSENELIRIAEKPVKYSPFTYNKKYFTENVNDTSFNYDFNSPRAPPIWARTFPKCGGERQSPINLRTVNCLRANLPTPLHNHVPNLAPQTVILENNGLSVEYTFEYQGVRPMLTGGPLKSMYVFEQLHFHWGSSKGQGSEHYIDSIPGELEMHMVHRNAKYANMTEATANTDGIVVLSVLFKADENTPDRQFLAGLEQLRDMHSTATIRDFPGGFEMRDIVGPFTQKFIAYQGSLTTPPCHEAVSWLVAAEMHSISERDMDHFRRILGQTGREVAPNYRPLQDRNNRMCMIF